MSKKKTCIVEPTIEEFPTDTYAIEGEGVIFKAIARGNPAPSLTWYHKDAPLASDYNLEISQDGNLLITSAELSNTGVYRLVAENSKGSVEREVRLTVAKEEEEEKKEVVETEKVYMNPIPVENFGDYVVQCHSNSNEIFKLQYVVGSCLNCTQNVIMIFS